MDRITFTWILESALLYWDGETKEKIIQLGSSEWETDIGINLVKYLY